MKNIKEFERVLDNIKAFAFDVDGVLTNGGILANLEGELFRTFDSKDGFGLRMASMKGYHLGIITGGRSESIRQRFLTCGVLSEDVYLGSRDKVEDFDDFCQRHSLAPEEVMYFGDDVPDAAVMIKCGIGVAPSDAVEEVKAIADFVSEFPGGGGCVRNTVEMVIRHQGKWNLDVAEYKKKF